MNWYNIPPGRLVGDLKEAIKEAILEGIIPNEKEAAVALLAKLTAEKGIFIQK